ncbi:MAG: prolipoprotein diacylglyceryl transferase family protein [Streptosporangiaceae bacterium]
MAAGESPPRPAGQRSPPGHGGPVLDRPGILPASWAAAVTAGVALTVILLVLLLGRVGADVPRALAVSAAVVAGGMTGARLWYVRLQRGEVAGLWAWGLCLQGTIAGGALAAVPALLLAGIAVGTFSDATAPGLFYAMAVGRAASTPGAAPAAPTASRFGIWSSDGRVGIRHTPAQHFEALVSVLLGTGALLAFLALGRAAGGTVFAGKLCEARPSPIRKVSGNRLKPNLLSS